MENAVQKVAVVTGAGSGIGRASSLAFARRGDAVVVSDVDVAAGRKTVAMIEVAGGTATFEPVDVTVEADVERLVEHAISRYGRLDYAHNNAGHGGSPTLVPEYEREEWDQLVALNLTGTWLCLKHEIPPMVERGGGAIVNTASTFGVVGVKGMGVYVACKHAVVGLTKGAALEYAEAGVRVNAICPGATRTPQLEEFFGELTEDPEEAAATYVDRAPIGRLGTPEEIAEVVIWLCSDAASFVTAHPMVADGGWVAQ